jgi:hypothetical protein
VRDAEGAPRFGRQPQRESRLGALQRATLLELGIDRLIDDSHAAFANFPNDEEAVGDEFASGKPGIAFVGPDQRLEEEIAHLLLVRHLFDDVAHERGPAWIGVREAWPAGVGRQLYRHLERFHEQCVFVGSLPHEDVVRC